MHPSASCSCSAEAAENAGALGNDFREVELAEVLLAGKRLVSVRGVAVRSLTDWHWKYLEKRTVDMV